MTGYQITTIRGNFTHILITDNLSFIPGYIRENAKDIERVIKVSDQYFDKYQCTARLITRVNINDIRFTSSYVIYGEKP